MESEGNKKFIIGITLVATLGGLLFGYDTAVISGAVGSLQAFFIDSLKQDTGKALQVILEFRVTVSIVLVLISMAVAGIFLRLFKGTKGYLFSGILFVAVFGYVVYYIQKPMVLDEETANSLKGFVISSALVGCIVGGASGGFISRSLGRKRGLLLAAVLFLISALGSALPERMNFLGFETIVMFIFYRIAGGIGVGLASMISPMYIAEIAPANVRGRLVSWNQFAIILGMVIVYFVNFLIARQGTGQWLITTGWRWMFASETIPALMFFSLLLLVPETPRFLVMNENRQEALKILNQISGRNTAPKVLREIQESLREKNVPWLSYGGAVIVIGILLSVFQQFVGINVVLYYAPEIFRNMGSRTDVSLLQTIIVGLTNMAFTVLAIQTVDKFGRKPLMIIGALAMALAMFGLGLSFYLERAGLGSLVFMLVYVGAFAMSWGPVTWVLLSEIFPNSIRGAMSIAVAAMWIANLIISWTFPMMNDNTWLNGLFNQGFSYWIYGVMGLLAALFMWKAVPETRGKTLEEMEGLWKDCGKSEVKKTGWKGKTPAVSGMIVEEE